MRGAAETRWLDHDTSDSVAANRHRLGSLGEGRRCAEVGNPIEGDQEWNVVFAALLASPLSRRVVATESETVRDDPPAQGVAIRTTRRR
jgi:hypothetical protein